MKKIITVLSALAMLLSIPGCTPAATPTSEPALENEQLKDYTIVYPADYTEFRMDIVNELKAAIKHKTGVEISAIPDSEPAAGKEIILASSKRETAYTATVEAFDDRMDYVVAFDGDNIVLGGKNYYSDMRAVYDFLETYFGYDSITGKYAGETEKLLLSTKKVVDYVDPEFKIQAATWGPTFSKEEYIKDVAGANFNALMVHYYLYDKQQSHNLAKWCAKYEIQLMLNTNTSPEITSAYIYWDCPVIYGAYIWDEPSDSQFEEVQNICNQFREKYSQYGWEPFVNFAGHRVYEVMESEYLKDLEIMSYDWYFTVMNNENWISSELGAEGSMYLEVMQGYRDIAKEHDMKFWHYIQSYTRTGTNFFPEKMYTWQMYMSLCFDVESIMYFGYVWENEEGAISWSVPGSCVINRDFTKTANYYSAQKANAEMQEIVKLLDQYENVGAYTYNVREEMHYAKFEEYEDFGLITEVNDSTNVSMYGKETPILVGCFDAKEGNGKAAILLNLEIVEGGNTAQASTKFKMNAEKVSYYDNGEIKELTPDAEGYYRINVPNGKAVVIFAE